MQVLKILLVFGENERNIENRTLEIHIDDKYPLEFSITNARYDITSFEQKSVARLQLKSISSTTNSIDFSNEYEVNLYLKFPLNTFSTNNKVIDLTFDEYNKETKNDNIEFISSAQIKEKAEEKEQSNKIFFVIASIIIAIFILRHFDMSIIYNSTIKKCLKEGIIYQDGWTITRYDIGGPVKVVKTYRFTETSDGSAKDYLYSRKEKYSPKKIYEIVNNRETTSFQIITYKERVKKEINKEYIKNDTLIEALGSGMPDKIEYKVIWLRQKIYYLEQSIKKGPEQSLQTWHGPYGWRYESTVSDMRNFEYLERKLRDCRMGLQNLEMQKTDDNKNEWYWDESCF